MEQRPEAYQGNEPHVFISYAHKDADLVYPMIAQLQQHGLRLWYDEGIEVGSHWDRVIPQKILDSVCMICFVSRNFLASENCLDETHFAKEKKKGPLLIYLERAEIPIEVEFRASRLHALSLEQFPDTDALIKKILDTSLIRPCISAPLPSADLQESVTTSPTAPVCVPSELSREALFLRGQAAYNEENYAEAVALLQRAADRDYGEAINLLSDCYWHGRGVPEDKDISLKLLQTAAGMGVPDAQHTLGLLLEYGIHTEKNICDAMKWHRLAAEKGYAPSQWCLARFYHDGKAVPRDIQEAIRWYRAAAEQGNENAQYALGEIYSTGDGTAQNPELAFQWYFMAAQQDYAPAQHKTGECYHQGEGIPQDWAEAVKWYRTAAKQGYAPAQNDLGYCYEHGEGVRQNMQKAVKWYQQAAEQRHPIAQYNLGMCYFQGQGVDTDYHTALYWFQQAAQNGDADAPEMVNTCQRKLDQPKWWPF